MVFCPACWWTWGGRKDVRVALRHACWFLLQGGCFSSSEPELLSCSFPFPMWTEPTTVVAHSCPSAISVCGEPCRSSGSLREDRCHSNKIWFWLGSFIWKDCRVPRGSRTSWECRVCCQPAPGELAALSALCKYMWNIVKCLFQKVVLNYRYPNGYVYSCMWYISLAPTSEALF